MERLGMECNLPEDLGKHSCSQYPQHSEIHTHGEQERLRNWLQERSDGSHASMNVMMYGSKMLFWN